MLRLLEQLELTVVEKANGLCGFYTSMMVLTELL